ncbi:hypothetical protein WR25_20707 [Diploscapter pachys]|uniref:Uncharacterized protein n=1 Tax=Diploscapter pachys TaxID=2018661 RepID=A0A2A2J5Z1_9BILA|nr:hypothetical protein WR25_20707 [Diploscapter pachys]
MNGVGNANPDSIPVPKPRTKFVKDLKKEEDESTSSDPSSSYVNVSEKSSNEDRSNNNNKDISKADQISPPNRDAPAPPPVPKITDNPPVFNAPPPPPRPPPPVGWNMPKLQTTPARPAPPVPTSQPTGAISPRPMPNLVLPPPTDLPSIIPPVVPKRTTSNHSYVNIGRNGEIQNAPQSLGGVVQKQPVHRYESLADPDCSPSSMSSSSFSPSSPPAVIENPLYQQTGGFLVSSPSPSASLLLPHSKSSGSTSSGFVEKSTSSFSNTPATPPEDYMADYRTGEFLKANSPLPSLPANPGTSEKRLPAMPLNCNTIIPTPTRASSITSNPYTTMPTRNDFQHDSSVPLPLPLPGQSSGSISASSMADPFEACKSIDLARGDFKMVDSSSDGDVESDEDQSVLEGTIDGTAVCFFGNIQMHLGKKDRKKMLARIKQSNISFLEDEETEECISGPYTIATCPFIGLTSSEGTIEIRLADGEPQKRLTFTPEENANHWMMLLGECWLTRTQNLRCCITDIDCISMFGEVWLKLGTASPWINASVALCNNALRYDMSEEGKNDAYELDLKKILNIREKVDKNEWCTKCKKNSRGPFSLTLDGCTLYMECVDEWTTIKWFEAISRIITEPAAKLEDYRRTKENVPFIVDKCISFVESYGLRSEGVYRRNGKIVEAREIRAKLIQDPTDTFLIKKDDETVYAVADVLRQFFRMLDSPLICRELQDEMLNIASNDSSEGLYKQLFVILKRLPPVHYATVKKLIGHLKTVTDHNLENKQTVGNVAKVFGPTIFHTDNEDVSDYRLNSLEISVVAHLISGYQQAFEVSMHEEFGREMVEEKEKLKAPLIFAKATRADGMLIPVHVWQHENRPFNVKADRAAEEVCREAMSSRGVETKPGEKYALFEIMRGGALKRRLPPAEKLSITVLKNWLTWGITDGYFLFDKDANPFSEDDMSTFSGKIKFAESGSKSFHSCEARIEEGVKITLNKAEKCLKTLQLDETICYYGAESSRKASYSHNLTFVCTKAKRDGSAKYSGICLSFKTDFDRRRFANAIQYVQTGGSATPLVHI